VKLCKISCLSAPQQKTQLRSVACWQSYQCLTDSGGLLLSFEKSSTNLLYSMKTALLQGNKPSRLLNFQFDRRLDGKRFSQSKKRFMNK
jgi:hypothetical protein